VKGRVFCAPVSFSRTTLHKGDNKSFTFTQEACIFMLIKRAMKVCLINPPVLAVLEPWYDTPDFGRTGLAYLAGYLRQFPGYELKIIDAKLERLDFKQVSEKVRQWKPDIVGLTAFTNEIKPAAYQAALIKQALPQVITIIGGVHVTSLPQATLQEFPSFDIGVVGEGEQTLFELCEAIQNGSALEDVKGLVFRQGAGITLTTPRERIADQDSIPFPAWDLLPTAKTYFVQSIRGCPFNCLFCMNPNGKIARMRSVSNVMEELNLIVREYQPERISFGDELFSVDMARTHELLDAMIAEGIGDLVKWDVQTHVNYVNEDLFLKFKAAKVDRVELGVETGDEATLKKMGKGTRLEQIIAACDAGRKTGVNIGTFLLFGQPNETIESIHKTIDIAVKINPVLPMFGLMTPYPGTEVARMAANGEGGYRLLTTDWDEYNKQIGGAMEFANLSRRQIEWLQVKAYLMVYLKNHRYRDLLGFLWEYRKGAWEVFKKILLRRSNLKEIIDKPEDYEQMIRSPHPIPPSLLADAREAWQKIQNDDLRYQKQQKALNFPGR
jgi:anaerobic magnesium-protoporphyrin IX monomethyl ester cyclase